MLKTRIITALVLLAVLLLAIFSGSFAVFAVVAGVFLAAAAWECLRLFGNKNPLVGAAIWTAAFAWLVASGSFRQGVVLAGLCVAIWALRLAPSLAIGLPPLGGMGSRLLASIYGIALLGAFVSLLALFEHSTLYMFSVMAIIWVADIGAYISGKSFGKHKLAPSISPGKSWEGAIGGGIFVLVFCAATVAVPTLSDTFAVRLYQTWGWSGFLIVLIAIVAASVVGDLFESQLKRRIAMKDSSNLLPGHGGVLDRFDALIPTLPFAVLVGHWM